jgi:hypothetical protein
LRQGQTEATHAGGSGVIGRSERRAAQRRRADSGVGSIRLLPNAVVNSWLTLLVVALLAALAGRVLLLLLTGLRLLALLLLSRPLLTAALLLTGLLVGSLRRLPILIWTIHLSTSWVKIQHYGCNAC